MAIRTWRPRDAASRHLCATDPDFAALIGRVGPCRIDARRDQAPYEALVRAVAHQQVHGRAAAAILGRLVAASPGATFPAPAALASIGPEGLRACGFSGAKAATLLGIADAARSGLIPTIAAARRLSDDILIERLSSLRGIGRWTVEMLLIFTLGRPDILPVDDFGVREGYRKLKQLAAQPAPKVLAIHGLDWSPYRSTAAWYLWRAAEEGRPAGRGESSPSV